jgi:DNA-binding transcriptional MerR regulator
MARYSIKDLENLTGIMAHTIRMWEKRYAIVSPRRTDTNIRLYCDEDLKRLLNISILNRHGIKISRIACLSDEDLAEQVLRLTQYVGDYESQIENLVIAMIDLDEDKFERLLSKVIMQMGFESTVTHIIYPFFDKVGLLWQTGSISPAQEHFVSNLIRQKLIVAIDGLMPVASQDHKTFLLFLPENELHEIGLLFYEYLICKKGHKVIYLGQSVPFEDLMEVCKIRHIHYLLTSFTANLSDFSAHGYLTRLKNTFPDKKILITGLYLRDKLNEIPEGIEVLPSPSHFLAMIDQL